ncbi:MAG: Hsp20/alpha crystallin family protein [Nitrospirae bacterium]|nr:MAG: Hsp20/alpha crystallin family protein [Nitrospirota bacterium]
MKIFNEVFYLREEAEKAFPPVDVYEKPGELIVIIDMPGVDVRDVLIKIYRDELLLEGVKKKQQEELVNYLCVEREFRSFRRRIKLPAEVVPERGLAKYQNGVIIVTLPKREDRVYKIKIEID